MFLLKPILLPLVLIALLSAPALADEIFSLKGGYLRLTPEGDVAVSSTNLSGSTLALEDKLGVGGSDGYFLETVLQLGAFRLFAAYLPITFSGASVLAENVDFNGETFVLGSRVQSEVAIDIYEAGLAWFLINLDDLPVRVQLGPEVSVKYVDTHVELQEGAFGQAGAGDFGVPLPTVGLRCRLAIAELLGAVGRVDYAEYNNNSFLDVDAQLEFSPLPLVGFFAGYRYLDIAVDQGDLLIDATFSGPYAGALIRF